MKCNCALCGGVTIVRFLVEPIEEEKEGFYCDPCAKKVDPDFEPIEDDIPPLLPLSLLTYLKNDLVSRTVRSGQCQSGTARNCQKRKDFIVAKKKGRATFTKEVAAQNREMVRRAKELLKDADLDTVPKDHPDVMETIQNELPGVNEVRIWARMAQALRQLRYEKYHIID